MRRNLIPALAVLALALSGASTPPSTLQTQINNTPWTNSRGLITGAAEELLWNTNVSVLSTWAAPLDSPNFTGIGYIPSGWVLNTPASLALTNATGCLISSPCVSGLGTSVASLLAGSASGTGGPAGWNAPSLTNPTGVTQIIDPRQYDVMTPQTITCVAANNCVDSYRAIQGAITAAAAAAVKPSAGPCGIIAEPFCPPNPGPIVVEIPPGTYQVNTCPVVPANVFNLIIEGQGRNTTITTNGANICALKFLGPSHNTVVRHINLIGGGIGSTIPTLWKDGSQNGEITDVWSQGGYNALSLTGSLAGGAFQEFVHSSRFGDSYGNAVVSLNSLSGSSGVYFDGRVDNDMVIGVWPCGTTPTGALATISAFAGTTSYSLCKLVSSAGYVYQVTTAGTSGGSPPALVNYGQPTTSGGATFYLVGATTYHGTLIDSGITFFDESDTDHTGPYTAGIQIQNTLGGTAPINIYVRDGTFAPYFYGIDAVAGDGLSVIHSQFASGVGSGGGGIQFDASYTGDAQVSNNLIFGFPGGNGIAMSGGAGYSITGNIFSGNGAYGVFANDGVSHIAITGANIFGGSHGANTSGAIGFGGTTGDYVTISGNDLGVGGSVVTPPVGAHNAIGVTCAAGSPSASFAVFLGIITHC